MAQEGRTALKAYFETGDIPTEAQFINLIDSLFNITDDDSDDQTEGVTKLLMTVAERASIAFNSLGAFTGSLIELSTSGAYDDLTLAANQAVTFAESGHVDGSVQLLDIISDGGDILTFVEPTNYALDIPLSLTNGAQLASGIHELVLFFKPGKIKVRLNADQNVGKDVTAPLVSTLTIEDAAATDLVMVFDEIVIGTNLGFTINGTTSSVFASISGSGSNTITGVMADAAVFGETITLDFSSVTGDITDLSGNPLATFSGTSVTNNVAASYTFANTHELVVDAASGEGVTVVNNNCYPSNGAGTDDDVSFAFWYETPAAIGDTKTLLVARDNNDDNVLFTIARASNNTVTCQFLTDGSNILKKGVNSLSILLSASTRYHIVLTKTGETFAGIKIYIDAVEVTYASDSSTGTYTGLPAIVGNLELDIGNSQGGASGIGFYQIYRQFNIELNSTQVTFLYNSGTPIGIAVGDAPTLNAACQQENLFNNNALADNIGNDGTTEGVATYQAI